MPRPAADATTDAKAVGELRPVTPAYLRANDPGFVVRVLQRADTPDGRRMAAAVVTPELLAQRSRILAANRPYLQGVVFNRVRDKDDRREPPKPAGSRPRDDKKPEIGKPVTMAPGGDSTTLIPYCDFGPTFQSPTEAASAEYRGTARQAGTLRIGKPSGTVFRVERVDVLTGEIKNGEPEAAAVSGSGSQFHVEAGQEYVVRLRMDLGKSGTFSDEIPIEEPTRKVRLQARGKVVETNGGFGCWVRTKGFYLIPGTDQKGVLHIAIQGNAPTTVRVSGTGPSGTTIVPVTRSAKAKDEFDVPFTVRAPSGAANADGALDISVSAYDGKASTVAHASARVETVWSIAKDYRQSAGNVGIVGTIRFSSAGDWEYAVSFSDSSVVSGDLAIAAFMIDRPLANGRRLGTSLWSDWIGGAISPGTQTLSSSGHDARLVGPALVYAPVRGFLVVETAVGSGLVDKYDYWLKSNAVDPLVVNP